MTIFELILPLITKLLGKWLDDYITQGDDGKKAKSKYLEYIKSIEPSLNLAVKINMSTDAQAKKLKEQWMKLNIVKKELEKKDENTKYTIIP